MKRIGSLLLLALLTCAPLCALAAQPGEQAIVTGLLGYWDYDPVAALYTQPDTASPAAAYLFENTPVQIVSDTGDPFVFARIGDYEGYILRRALRFGAAPDAGEYGTDAAAIAPLPLLCVPLYQAPDEASAVLEQIPLERPGVIIRLLTDEWGLVEYQGQSGYVRANYLSKTENYSFSTLEPDTPAQRVRLYARAGDPDSLLGEYYGYLSVRNLFDLSAVHGGYRRVSIGGVSGYVSSGDSSSDGDITAPFLPPHALTSGDTALYEHPDAQGEALTVVPEGTTLEILGVYDAQGTYHVRWGALYAFVRQSDLPDAPQCARLNPVLAIYKTTRDTELSSWGQSYTLERGTRLLSLYSFRYGDELLMDVWVESLGIAGAVRQSDVTLVVQGETLPDQDPLFSGYRTRYAVAESVLRREPDAQSEALYTFSSSVEDSGVYLLGGVLPDGYVHVRRIDGETPLEGYMLAQELDSAHW